MTFVAGAGRKSGLNNLKSDNPNDNKVINDSAANYQYAGLGYADGKFVGGVDYHHLNADNFLYIKDGLKETGDKTNKNLRQSKEDNANIWLVKGAYRFDKTNALNAFYANNTSADDLDKAWSAEYDYKGAQPANKGSWGMWAAYRYLGDNTALFSTYDALLAGQKGWEIGTNYTPFKNVIATLRYGNGKDISTDKKIENLFGRVEFLF